MKGLRDAPLDFQGCRKFSEKKIHLRHEDEDKIAPVKGRKKKITMAKVTKKWEKIHSC